MKQGIPKSAHDVLGRQPASQEHPSADLLNGFVEQGLGAAEKEQVTAHLATCAECREVVFLAGGAAEAPEPATLDQPLPVAPTRWSFWNWKWIVPAVAAVAIAAGVTLMREDAKYPRTTASPSINARLAAPSRQMNEELSDKDAATRRDAVKESKPAAQPEQELAKKSERAAGQKQNFAPEGQPPAAAKLESVPNRDSTAVGASLPDSFYSSTPAAKVAEKSPPTVIVGQLDAPGNEAKDRGLMTKPSSSGKRDLEASSSLAAPASAADSSAKVLHKSKAAASEAGGGPSETAAARQNQQAVQQQQVTVDSASGAGSLIEGKPVSVRFSDWRITGDGHLERGSSSGEWTRVLADQPGYIQTVAQVGSDVWAGSDDGTLFHSSDGGENWSKVRVGPDEHRPIVSIRFRTGSEGTVTTDLSTTWKTSDGGKSWSKQ